MLREFVEDVYDREGWEIFCVPLDDLWEKLKREEEETGNIKLATSGE